MKRQSGELKAILVDFDGVLRRWPDSDGDIEERYGLTPGSISHVAFKPSLLDQAIRGKITDAEWRQRMIETLNNAQPDSDASSAITEWSAGHGEIDRNMLALLSAYKPYTEILLLTNATTRLNEDLAALELGNWFLGVLNSSDIGSVKPEPEIYQRAIQACGCSINNIVYIDDSLPNTMSAIDQGILSHHYTDVDSCKQFLLKIGLPVERTKQHLTLR